MKRADFNWEGATEADDAAETSRRNLSHVFPYIIYFHHILGLTT